MNRATEVFALTHVVSLAPLTNHLVASQLPEAAPPKPAPVLVLLPDATPSVSQ